MKGICGLLFPLLCLPACNPARRIDMINHTSGEAEFLWIIREDSIPRSPFFLSSSDTLRIRLGNRKPRNTAKMSFSPGTWSPDELTRLVGGLRALEIHTDSGTIKLEDAPDLKTFLFLRRRGLDGSIIRIALTEPGVKGK
jgi:hypothetical protein